MKTEKLLYCIEGLVVMSVVMFLMPTDDDWFYLRYFNDPNDWGISSYAWLGNNHWLIRDYWRPIEDFILHNQAHYAPWSFPWLQHVLIVALAFGAGWSAICLGVKAGASPRRMTIITMIGMLAATNLGALTSIDSFTQVSAAFWGLLSIRIFCSSLRLRKLLWLASIVLACMSKESGFIFAICGPVYKWMTSGDTILTRKAVARALPGISVAVLLMIAYLAFYFIMKQQNVETHINSDHIIVENTLAAVGDTPQQWLESTKSHTLTPITIVKNIAILYTLGLYPIAVQGLYYANYTIVAISLLLGWGGCVLLWFIWRKAGRRRRNMFLKLVVLGVIVSLPAFITRAGEISPFNSNMLFLAAVGVLATGYKMRRVDWVLAVSFLSATLLTDSYKYSLAYRGGVCGENMGEEAARLTPPDARRILWLGVDESSYDKAGAAFTKSPYRAFGQGSAALRAMGYPENIELTKYYVLDTPDAAMRIDSIAKTKAADYDCIWITSDDRVKVKY